MKKTIIYCGFKTATVLALSLEDGPLSIDYLSATISGNSLNSDVFKEYVVVDNEVAVLGMLTDNDILEEVSHINNGSDEDDDNAEGNEI